MRLKHPVILLLLLLKGPSRINPEEAEYYLTEHSRLMIHEHPLQPFSFSGANSDS